MGFKCSTFYLRIPTTCSEYLQTWPYWYNKKLLRYEKLFNTCRYDLTDAIQSCCVWKNITQYRLKTSHWHILKFRNLLFKLSLHDYFEASCIQWCHSAVTFRVTVFLACLLIGRACHVCRIWFDRVRANHYSIKPDTAYTTGTTNQKTVNLTRKWHHCDQGACLHWQSWN